jgi:dTMP kinase
MARAQFITFEGGEGTGKSTQAAKLQNKLEALGVGTVLTREPGGAPQAEVLREILVTGAHDRWSPMAESLLNYAARDDHLRNTVKPALEAGKWVISDRFSDSTRAYQGGAGGVDKKFIHILDEAVVGGCVPDLTLIFDMPAILGLERAQTRGGPDRFEGKGLAFHDRLREAFLGISENNPDRCVLVDATGTIDDVADAVWWAVESRLKVPHE